MQRVHLADRPLFKVLRRVVDWQEWPTVLLLVAAAGLWLLALVLPTGWGPVAFVILVLTLALHSSLSHEILHGHPTRNVAVCTLIGAVQPGLFVPYLRFRALHLAHHRDDRLTDPYDDPESNYHDPEVWERLPRWRRVLLGFNNTLSGRMLIGPALGMAAFIGADWRAVRTGERAVLWHWAVHLPGVAVVIWAVDLSVMSIWTYLAACYAAMSVLKIRTFLEHRAHGEPMGRTVVVEDRGLLSFLFLNNNFHLVHHLHPHLCWHRLPNLYRAQRADFLIRNEGYVYPSYRDVFRKYFRSAKDPVAHPLWRGSKR